MTRLEQFLRNSSCLITDLTSGRRHWKKIPFHFQGVKRAIVGDRRAESFA